MTVKVAVNGYGRIGSQVLRAIYEYGLQDKIKVVAINSRSPIETIAHLTRYDSAHGRFNASVESKGEDRLVINGDEIVYSRNSDPADNTHWKELGIDVALECTGIFRSRDKVQAHLQAGAKKVLISAPGEDVDATIVYGVNEGLLKASDLVVSNASCTTNCLAPVAKVLDENFGIVSGLMTTIHSYTSDQRIIDSSHKDLRRARSAAVSMIPTKTGAAKAVGLVLPQLAGKFDGMAVRVPTQNVSLVDLSFIPKKKASVDEINTVIKTAADANNSLGHVLGYTDEPLVSVDFNHQPESSIFDLSQTKVMGDMVKIMTWYDNEWGFSCRMIDTAIAMANAK